MNREEFESLPIKCRRMAIAEDVIAQIGKGSFIPTQREYIVPSSIGTDKWFEGENYRSDVSDKIMNDTCHVCAIGAAFVSAARCGAISVDGGLFMNQAQSKFVLTERLRGIFDTETLRDMEIAFEGFGEPRLSMSKVSERLEGIMRYVLEHEGEFDLYDFKEIEKTKIRASKK